MNSDWTSVIEVNAASELTGRRLVAQLRACEASSLAFCRLLERWGRGDAMPATARRASGGAAASRRPRRDGDRRPRAAARAVPPGARARARRGTVVVRRPGCRRARRVAADPRPRGRARLSEPCGRRLPRAGGARARTPRSRDGGEPRRPARPLVALGRALRPPGHTPRLHRRRPSRTGGVRPRIAVVGSINLDLVARCVRLPRAPARRSRVRRSPGIQAARAETRPSHARVSGPT